MMKVISLLAMTMALTSLTGCGLKGPLYFPPQDTPKQAAPTSAPTQKQKAEASKADVGGLVTGGPSSSSQMK